MTETPQDPYGGQPYSGPPASGPPASGPPVYGQPAYGQPTYGQPTYGQPPSAYPPPGYYPQQGYPYGPPAYGYPQPYYPQQLRRPGTATASSVLAFVNGGLLIAAALLLFAGASLLSDLGSATQSDTSSTTTEFTLDGLVNLLAAGLLIAGGVMFAGRRTRGRALLVAGGVIVIVAAIYWMTRFDHFATTVFYGLLFTALAVLSMAMAYTATTKEWLSATPPDQPTAQYSPYG